MMKKILMICFFLMLILQKIAAQSETIYKNNMIRINPFGAFASAIPLNYERMFLKGNFSVVAGGAIISNKSGSGQTTYNNSGFSITPEARHYFYNDPNLPARIYAGVYFNYEEHKNSSLDRLNDEIEGFAWGRGGGVIFGNQWFFRNGFVIDFYVGPGYMSFQRSEEYDINIGKGGLMTSLTGPKNTGTKVKFGFSLGISF
jgi:hypothetical protein